jgi:hypothetical protein
MNLAMYDNSDFDRGAPRQHFRCRGGWQSAIMSGSAKTLAF